MSFSQSNSLLSMGISCEHLTVVSVLPLLVTWLSFGFDFIEEFVHLIFHSIQQNREHYSIPRSAFPAEDLLASGEWTQCAVYRADVH